MESGGGGEGGGGCMQPPEGVISCIHNLPQQRASGDGKNQAQSRDINAPPGSSPFFFLKL